MNTLNALETALTGAAESRGLTLDQVTAGIVANADALIGDVITTIYAADHLERISALATQAEQVEQARRAAVVTAARLGVSQTALARAAGRSRQWVHDLVATTRP
ncbi:MAG: hypothetical protein ACOH17_14245 [Cellulomonas sp.]